MYEAEEVMHEELKRFYLGDESQEVIIGSSAYCVSDLIMTSSTERNKVLPLVAFAMNFC